MISKLVTGQFEPSRYGGIITLIEEAAIAMAESWIAAWNRQDIAAIITHYADNASLSSPLIVERRVNPSGTIRGRSAIQRYFELDLRQSPQLRFEFKRVFIGIDGFALWYQRHDGRQVVENLVLDEEHRIVDAHVYYATELEVE
jgi:limonene-1,2-epoxide hydrolase